MGYKKKQGNSKLKQDRGSSVQMNQFSVDSNKEERREDLKIELADSERKLIDQVINVLTQLIWRYASQ